MQIIFSNTKEFRKFLTEQINLEEMSLINMRICFTNHKPIWLDNTQLKILSDNIYRLQLENENKYHNYDIKVNDNIITVNTFFSSLMEATNDVVTIENDSNKLVFAQCDLWVKLKD